jgi:hypothetical protein
MRAVSESNSTIQAGRIGLSAKISCQVDPLAALPYGYGGNHPIASACFTCDFFLFYLTGATIFDNRHGLLKQRDSVRTAKPLSAIAPPQ